MNWKNVQTYINVLINKEEWKYFSIHCYPISDVLRALFLCPCGERKMEMKMNMGHWLNDKGTVKSVYSERNVSKCYFAYHISHKDRSADEAGTSRYGTAVED